MSLILLVVLNTACQKEGTAEKAGKEVDKAFDAAKDKYNEMNK